MKKYLLPIIVSAITNCTVNAQHKLPPISKQDKDQIEAQADLDVQNFCFNISDLADKTTSRRQKDSLKAKTIRLFADSATIMVKAKSKDEGKKHPVLEYLNQVDGYSYRNKLRVITISFDQVIVDVNPANLRDTIVHNQRAYVGRFSFLQIFRVKEEEKLFIQAESEIPSIIKPEYSMEWGDNTRKYGTIIIIPKKRAGNGPKYKVLLGDITAGEVVVLKRKG